MAYFSYGLGAVFLILLWTTNYFINGYYKYFWGYYPKANFLHLAYLLLISILAGRAIFLLGSNLEKEKSVRYNQTRYVLLALIVYIFAALDFVANYGIEFYPLGFIAILLSLGIISYAILRHRLMNIEIVIKKTAVYSLLTVFITGVIVSVILASEQLFRGITGYGSIWAGIVGAFVIALIFQPLRNKIQEMIDRLFFKGKYDYRNTLKELSRKSASIIELDRLLDLVFRDVTEALKVEKVGIYLLEEEKGSYNIRKIKGK